MVWTTSDRAQRLPPDWEQRKVVVKRRARGRCQATTHARGCTGRGTQVDHIHAGDDHGLHNLQLLSEPCHKAKNAEEAAERNRARAQMRRRPPEAHPGQLTNSDDTTSERRRDA